MKNYSEREYTGKHRRLTAVLALALAAAFALTSLDVITPLAAEQQTTATSTSGNAAQNLSQTAASQNAASQTSSQGSGQDATNAASADSSDANAAYQQSVEVKEGKRTLTVEASADAGVLPSDAKLVVLPVTKDDKSTKSTYKAVEKKLSDNASDAQKELVGFAAYDIHFESDGQKVEPSGAVAIHMDWSRALSTKGADQDTDVAVLHLEGSDASAVKDSTIVDLTENARKAENAQNTDDSADSSKRTSASLKPSAALTGTQDTTVNTASVETAKNSSAVNKADMTVDGFSVFTITWTKGTSSDSDTTRIGNVVLHYVDSNGLEHDLNDESTMTAENLAKKDGGIVILSQYAQNLKADDDGTQYYYDHAVIGSRDGKTITGLKVESSTETKSVAERDPDTGNVIDNHDVDVTVYKLYYTNASDVGETTDWKEYRDSAGDSDASDADIYLIYKDHVAKPVNIHFMTLDGDAITDADGNALVRTIDGAEQSKEIDFVNWLSENAPSGYAIQLASGGGINTNKTVTNVMVARDNGSSSIGTGTDAVKGENFRYLKYDQNSDHILTGRVTGNVSNRYNAPGAIDSNPVEIYVTLKKTDTDTKTKTFTVKYKYIDKDDKEADTNTDDVTFTLSSTDKEKYLDNTGEEDNLVLSNVTKKSDNGSLIYLSTRLGSAHGPTVTSVYVDDSGDAVYHYENTRTMSYQRRNQWYVADSSTGRNFTLYLDSNGNYSLNDSQHGTIDLNKSRDAADTSNVPKRDDTFLDTDDTSDLYTATFHGERETTKYTVEAIGDLYNLTVEDWLPSNNTTIYETYIDGSNTEDKLWIEDDLKYSGYFKIGMSDILNSKINSASAFTWHRVVTTTAADGTKSTTDTVVARRQTYDHWNIASSPRNRTWLDIEADEGDGAWTKSRSVAYYVTLSYQESTKDESTGQTTTTTKDIQSDTIPVQYYGQLENGSFEDTAAKTYEQSAYLSSGGVWRTTAPGSSNTLKTGVNGLDIEVVSGRWHDNLTPNSQGSGYVNSLQDTDNGYHWTQSGGETSTNSWAEDGNNFAELNAENAGALYQDVITHPNETLSYWFSHRARGSKEGEKRNWKYDTMYLVIMPTKLAMTGSSDGTELKTQTELQKFIETHGGFDSAIASGQQDKVTYSDKENGILIRKISSSQNGWHDVSATNGYIAKGGLTRFFFVAGSSCGDAGRYADYPNRKDFSIPTTGNFIDNVGFAQTLPPTSGFNLTVTETFSGITQEELAGLASNAASVPGVTPQKNALQVRLSDTNVNASQKAIDALNGATLGFTVAHTGSGYTFIPTATIRSGSNDIDLLKANDEIKKPGTANVRTNADGSITMTWTFPDQELKSGDDSLTDGRFRYSAVDSVGNSTPTVYTSEVAGYTLTRSRTTEGGEEGSTSNNAVVTQHTDATIHIVNTYAKNPHISVRKTFSGLTQDAVQKLMKDGYTITVKKQGTNDSKTLKASENTSDVEVSGPIHNNDDTTYVWTITDPDWQTGTYEVSESGYDAAGNTVRSITLNGNNVTESTTDETKQEPTATSSVTISSDASGTLSYNRADVKSAANVSFENLGSNINLIVAQYGSGNDTRYIVWTENSIGLITRNAVLSKINSDDLVSGLMWTNETDATSANTKFFSGLNNGATSITVDDRSLQFDGTNLTLSGTGDKTWNEYYATHYSVSRNSSLADDSEIRLTNSYETGIILPITGGMGAWPFILAGLTFVMMAGAWSYIRSRKQSRETFQRLMEEIHGDIDVRR